ncbi:Protein phosphatase 1, regulatory subunit, and related proteins [Plasmopara halstedii]|uniref:Protein phosphatase 1, regulatory subunit, and related proteins n=1 Tax=Plasmopara halstedii TaxID=4781 RepID=A0A0P1AHY6_PLAHL|nr:Protein phosphatase 1, regulatory subunit, and related proteins [Plasmopara halstedii]CEG40327.1 Protein phosphatase 1, regulatory subunit, and related proteins [Plasmopara halstedii]|eukprot:XP_024576696.1 Protein phosphatase 1, regulatory subunit, and related proteins [Plasmopara halstedii]
MAPPPPPPLEPALGLNIISHVNAGLEYIDDLENDEVCEELVEQMNLHGNSVQSMDGLEVYTGLVELCLSSNCIEEIAFHALQPLVHLRVLDLSANRILSTLGFPQLPRLEELSIAHNCLQGLDGLIRPIKFPKLHYLDLRGNEIAEFNDVLVLQRLKRLAHVRLQAISGKQANPVCELDGYHQIMIQMLPRLRLLDEEEIDILKEMGSLHMPKYQSFMRRIVESNRPHRISNRMLRNTRQNRSDIDDNDQDEIVPAKRYTDRERSNAKPLSGDTKNSRLHQDSCTAQNEDKTLPAQKLVVKDMSTNTSVDLEKDILEREHTIAQKETELLEIEKAFLTKENYFLVREDSLKAQICDLQDQVKAAEARAIKADATVLELSNHLLKRENEQTAAALASDDEKKSAQNCYTEQQSKYEVSLAALKTTHQQEVDHLDAQNAELEKQVAEINIEFEAFKQRLLDAEERIKHKSDKVKASKSKVAELTGELELALKTHEAIAKPLSDENKYLKDRVEQADKRSGELEKQVTELKSNVETVYNKCIERDETIQHLKKSLLARQDDIDALKLQHEKDCMRHEKFQQQQQDVYERQLQTSIIQLEMEFRKEYHQCAQKLQTAQRKTQERSKDVKRLRDAYQHSLQREAAAKVEIEKLQAILADDQKRLLVEDAKRVDTYKAAIREERAKCKELEHCLMKEQENYAQMAAVSAERDEQRIENERLCNDISLLKEQLEKWNKVEDDLRAALKVKDVMLADQLRQIKELTQERRRIDAQVDEEMAEYQTQIEELEAALDESLRKAAEEEVKNETLDTKLIALEKDTLKKDDQLKSLRTELEQKVSALEFLDQEMQRMRKILENQDDRFQKRMQTHLEQHQETVERIRASAEEEREHQLQRWKAERREMMLKYETLSTEMENVAAVNAKLRVTLDEERRKTAQNDHDMRILLMQIDHERQSKKKHLHQIKSLFEQLQRESS